MTAKAPAIGVFGLWHLGCVLSAAWSSKGCRVTGFDYDQKLIQDLKAGTPPIFEPDLAETISKNSRRGFLSFSSDLSDLSACDFIFLSYDTPVLENDESDLAPLKRAVKDLGPVMKEGAVLIVSSQTPAGTCAGFRKSLKSEKAGLELVYSPENLRLGQAIRNYLNPGRIILGAEDERARKKVLGLFKRLPADVICMNLESAEMVKHGINAFLASSIAFTNELSDACEKAGADILKVVEGMKSDPRIGQGAYLSPGIGFSGGTLGRDLKVLQGLMAPQNGKINFFGNILSLNGSRKDSVIGRLKSILPGQSLSGRRIGVLGLTYKPGTSTLRRSLPVEIVRALSAAGANVNVYDPKADLEGLTGPRNFGVARSGNEVLQNSEAVLILTEWPEFKKLSWKASLKKENPQIVYDAKNCLLDLNLGKMGYHYIRVGLSSRAPKGRGDLGEIASSLRSSQ